MIEAFRTEIIEAEKSRTDLLKWKLIIVGALIAVGIGYGNSATTNTSIRTQYAIALAPFIATYVDLLCINLQFRILVISEYFQNYPDSNNQEISFFKSYEKHCGELRSVFGLEDIAQVGSTVVLSILVVLASCFMKFPNIIVYQISGGIGVVASILLFGFYWHKSKTLRKDTASNKSQ